MDVSKNKATRVINMHTLYMFPIADFELFECATTVTNLDPKECSDISPVTTNSTEQIHIPQHAFLRVGNICYDWTDGDIVVSKII